MSHKAVRRCILHSPLMRNRQAACTVPVVNHPLVHRRRSRGNSFPIAYDRYKAGRLLYLGVCSAILFYQPLAHSRHVLLSHTVPEDREPPPSSPSPSSSPAPSPSPSLHAPLPQPQRGGSAQPWPGPAPPFVTSGARPRPMGSRTGGTRRDLWTISSRHTTCRPTMCASSTPPISIRLAGLPASLHSTHIAPVLPHTQYNLHMRSCSASPVAFSSTTAPSHIFYRLGLACRIQPRGI